MAQWTPQPRCRTCGEKMSSHPSCCGAHPFSKHAVECPNRAADELADLHRDRPDECDECGQFATADFRCIKCGLVGPKTCVLSWDRLYKRHKPTPTKTAQEVIDEHRSECGVGAAVVLVPAS